jgi:YD repeat-containing protein
MQGHWGDALLSAGMLAATYLGGRALGSLGKYGAEAEEGGASALTGAEHDAEGGIGDSVRGAEGNGAAVCETDPVDVVSGWMLTHETDLTLAGVLPLVLRRAYASGYGTGRLFGAGWASTLDQRLAINEAGIHFAGDDAQTLHYPVPSAGEPVLPGRGDRWPLVWDRATDEIRISDPRSGRTRHFAVVHFGDEVGRIRDLTAITDRNGNRISILRTDDGTPFGVEHSGGYRIAVDAAVTAQGPRVTGLRLLDGSEHGVTIKKFGYDGHGRLTEVTDSSGVPLRYEHDAADRVTAWIDRTGYRYTYEYDHTGRVVRTGGDEGSMAATLVHDEDGRTTTITDAAGGVTEYRYDEAGHVTQVTDALGAVTRFEHDEAGRIAARTDALGHTTRISRDANGDVTHVARPDGTSIGIAYHETLRAPVRIVGPDNAVWRYSHDAAGNLVRTVDPAGSVFEFSYDEHGAVVSSSDALGHVTAIATDGAGLPVAVTNPLGTVNRVRRDAFGRPVEFTGPHGVDLRLGWTTEGRPAWRTTADGVRSTWRYDAAGNLLEHQDPNGGTTAFEYGPFAKPTARTGADGHRIEFAYDAELHLTSVTDPLGRAWRYAYDAAGRLVGETDFGGRNVAYRHDALGRVVERVNGAGQAVRLERDPLGRVVAQTEAFGGVTRFGYDPAGRMTAAGGATGSLTYARDVLGRIVAESVDGRTLESTYDNAGRRTRRVTPTGAVSDWSFDAAGKPLSLDTSLGGALSFAYDGAGHEVSRRLGPITELTQTFDELGRLTGQLIRAQEPDSAGGSRTLQHREYSYRADGVPIGISDLLRGDRLFALDPVPMSTPSGTSSPRGRTGTRATACG